MATARKRMFSQGTFYRISACLVAFVSCLVVLPAHARIVSTNPETGARTFRFTPTDSDFALFSTTWNNNPSGFFRSGDVYEFEESDEPYIFKRTSSQGDGLYNIAFRGVKADGSPADPAKVVFAPDSDSADYSVRGGVTNSFKNITFSNISIFVQCDFNAISNCRFTGMKKRAAIYGQFAVNDSYVKPGWSAWATGCRFENSSGIIPGAAYNLYGFAATNCVFSGNINADTNINGGGAIAKVGNLSCRDCVFENNRTTGMYGGAVHLTHEGVLAIESCVFTNNCANQVYNRNDSCGGGALSISAAVSGYVRNCLFAENSITTEIAKNSYDGGAIRIANAAAAISIENCTFAKNTITVGGTNKDVGGALAARQGTVGVTNCVFYGNRGMLGSVSWKTSHLSVADWMLVSNCLEANFKNGDTAYDFSSIDKGDTPAMHIVDGVNGNKVGDYDPKFTDAAKGDYSLLKKSACRDAGATVAWMDASSVDLAGEPRVVGDAPDIGCYEWYPTNIGLSIIVR